MIKKFLWLTLVFALAGFVGYTFAENPPGGQKVPPAHPEGPPKDMPFKEKHLIRAGCMEKIVFTEEQDKTLKKIYDGHKKEMETLTSDMEAKLQSLKDALKSNDEQAFRKAHKEMSQVREDTLVLKLKIFKEIKDVLSEDQKKELESCIDEKLSALGRQWKRDFFKFLGQPW